MDIQEVIKQFTQSYRVVCECQDYMVSYEFDLLNDHDKKVCESHLNHVINHYCTLYNFILSCSILPKEKLIEIQNEIDIEQLNKNLFKYRKS